MKYYFFILISLTLFSCTENDQKMDTETNTYYAKYLYIYNNYDSLGFEKSVTLLDEYISEFPNAQNAYFFKAYLLAKNGSVNEVEPLFLTAQSYDSTNVDLYKHWASTLLYNSDQVKKAEEINNIGLAIDNNNIDCKNNSTWILLFQNKNEEALSNALNLLEDSLAQKNIYYRAAVIASIAAENDSIYSFYLPKVKSAEQENFNKLKNKEISIPSFYKTL